MGYFSYDILMMMIAKKQGYKNMKEEIYHDKDGNAYILDENGNHRPPMKIQPSVNSDGFRDYDTSNGHCGLCGSLTCHGNCFK